MRTFITVLVLTLTGAAAARGEVPWDRLPGVDTATLTDPIRARAVELLRSEPCYHECPDTVYACASMTPPARTALRMAGVVVRLLADGRSDEEIREELKNRARSAHPFKAAELAVEGMPRLGPATAAVTVVIFADFDCPYCRIVSPRLREIREELGDRVSIVFKLFPVKAHGQKAIQTSRAGWAAHLQGRFWDFHDRLYAAFERHGDEDLRGMARELGLDLDRFDRDRAAKGTEDVLRGLKREGVKLGVQSTPTIFVNGKRFFGMKTVAEIRDRIEEELDLVGR